MVTTALYAAVHALRYSPQFEQCLVKWPSDIQDQIRSEVFRGRITFVLTLGAIALGLAWLVQWLGSLMHVQTAAAIVLGLVSLFLWRLVIVPAQHYAALDRIPQAPRFPIIGHLYAAVDDVAVLFEKLEKTCAAYNPGAFVTWVFNQPVVFITDPDAVRAIVTADYAIAPKNMLTQVFLDKWLGKGLLTGGGHHWKMQRKLITPAFHFGALRTYFDVYKKHAGQLVDVLNENIMKHTKHYSQPFDVVPLITAAGLDIIAETACGYELNSLLGQNFRYAKSVKQACELLIDHINCHPEIPPGIWHRFSDSGRNCASAIETCQQICRGIVTERLQQRKQAGTADARPHDFLDRLLDATDEQGNRLSEQSILDNVNTFIFAGHDTTTVATSWLLFEVSLRPQIEAKLVAELLDVLKGRPVQEIDYDDLKQLKYMEMVMKESMRVHPSVPVYGRFIESPIDCGKFTIPAYTEVFIPTLVLHRLETHWECPEIFDPDRFSPERSVDRHPFVFLPFSAGARNCIGQAFAFNVEKTILAHLLMNFHFDVTDILKAQHQPSIVLHPKAGIRMVARQRSPKELEKLAQLGSSL